MRRRDVLKGVVALAAGCTAEPTPMVVTPSSTRDPSPDRPQPDGVVDADAFPWGVVVGDVLGGTAQVRVRTRVPGVRLRLQVFTNGAWATDRDVELDDTDWVADHLMDGLAPDSVYAIWASTSAGARSQVTRFRTAPFGASNRVIRFGASSCFGTRNLLVNSVSYADREDLDFFVLLGDTVYADGSRTREDYQSIWDGYLSREAMGQLFASTGMIAIWDDHEVDNNWTLEPGLNGSIDPGQLDVATRVLFDALPLPPRRLYRSVRWGEQVEVFLLDCRGERTDDELMTETQLQWLLDGVSNSSATFKVVCSSVHLADHGDVLGGLAEADRWQGYPEQRARLVATLANTPGTVVLTGDMHFGSMHTLDADGPGASLTEVATGPAGSPLLAFDEVMELTAPDSTQYEALVIDWNCCVFELDPVARTMSVRFVGDDGEDLVSRTVML